MGRLGFSLFSFFLLIILFIRFFTFYNTEKDYPDGSSIKLKTTLLSEPKNTKNLQVISLRLGNGARASVFTSLYPQFHYGQTIQIEGKISHKDLPKAGKSLTIYFPKIGIPEKEKNNLLEPFLSFAYDIRSRTKDIFIKSLPTVSASLLLGIVFGIKDQMPQDFIQRLVSTGVLHVVAASGMNVTLLGGFLSSFFTLFLRRQVGLIATIAAIFFYALLSGFESSIVRASIMGGVGFSAQILGRQRLALYSSFLAGFFMLFITPYLLFDVGFQLSFLSTLSIILFKPIIEHLIFLRRIARIPLIGDDIFTTISAQLGTLPILLANFSVYPILSILINALVLFTIPFLMIGGGLAAIAGFFFMPLGKIFLYLCLPFLLYFEKVVYFFSEDKLSLTVSQIPWQISLGYYLILIALVIIINKSRTFFSRSIDSREKKTTTLTHTASLRILRSLRPKGRGVLKRCWIKGINEAKIYCQFSFFASSSWGTFFLPVWQIH